MRVDARSSQAVASAAPVVLTPEPVPTPEGPAYARGIIRNVAVAYQNGDEHAENVELHLLPSKKMLLAFRAGGTGQAETGTARIRVFDFDPLSYTGTLASEVVPPASDPVRGIRDPKLFEWGGALKLGAISRVSGFPIRDLLADTRTVVATSHDEGKTFDSPVPTTFKLTHKAWGLWRYVSWHSPIGTRVLYATGYDDGDQEAAYFGSLDGGKSFVKLGSLVNAPGLVPSEAELNFLGKDNSIAVSMVQLDDQGLLEARIRTIRDRLDRSVLVDQASSESGEVGVGSTVEVEDENGERMTIEISSVGGVSPDSPLGGALLGASPGDIVDVKAPRGSWRARVIAVSH